MQVKKVNIDALEVELLQVDLELAVGPGELHNEGMLGEVGGEVGAVDVSVDEMGDLEELLVDEIPFSTPNGKSHSLSSYRGPIEPPSEGMTFKSWEMIEAYLRSYAKQQGFGIVRGSSAYRQRNGKTTRERRSLRWECEYYGEKDRRVRVNGRKVTLAPKMHSVSKKGPKLGTRKSKKCECPVHVYASASRDGSEWVVRRAVMDHEGHTPTPSKSRHVAMFRHDAINRAVRKKLVYDLEAGVKLPLIHRSMALERNDLENMPFTQRDLRNVVAKERKMRMEVEGGDANAMVNYLKKLAADNDKFFHEERVDLHNRLKDVMWVDARSRAAYEDFGDVVCFDITYITNRYHLPFANFVGVNHHGQCVLLGCALLRHENVESFERLFTKWLTCMGGRAPLGFLTDQCAAMRKAIANIMPEACHRWCLWHITQKFPHKFAACKNYEDIRDDLLSAIYDSLTVEEFHRSWFTVIEKHNLQDNKWLAGLFKEQHMWVPAHMRGMFWAGMKTTQRSESINSFFDGYVKKQTLLYEFIAQYFAVVEARANAEQNADADVCRNVQELVTGFPIEVEFQKVYTTAKFIDFQLECLKLMYVNSMERRNVNQFVVEHRIEDPVWYRCNTTRKDIPTDKYRDYLVRLDLRTNEARCLCRLFETHGIMCRHIVRVFAIHRVKKLPEMFILQRWRKDVERKHTKVKVRHHDLTKTEEVKRYDEIMVEFEPLCLLGAKSEEMKDELIVAVREIHERLEQKNEEAQRSKVGENLPVSPSSVNYKRRSGEAVRSNEGPSPSSVKKICVGSEARLNTTPPIGSQTNPVTSTSSPPQSAAQRRVVGGATTEPAYQLPGLINDPPLPKNPKHRTTDNRFKSAVELSRCKSKATKKGSETTKGSANSSSMGSSFHLPLSVTNNPGGPGNYVPLREVGMVMVETGQAQPSKKSGCTPVGTHPPFIQGTSLFNSEGGQTSNSTAGPSSNLQIRLPLQNTTTGSAGLFVPNGGLSVGAVGLSQIEGPLGTSGSVGYVTRTIQQPSVITSHAEEGQIPEWMLSLMRNGVGQI